MIGQIRRAVGLASRSLSVLLPPTFFVSLLVLRHCTSGWSEQQIHLGSHFRCFPQF